MRRLVENLYLLHLELKGRDHFLGCRIFYDAYFLASGLLGRLDLGKVEGVNGLFRAYSFALRNGAGGLRVGNAFEERMAKDVALLCEVSEVVKYARGADEQGILRLPGLAVAVEFEPEEG